MAFLILLLLIPCLPFIFLLPFLLQDLLFTLLIILHHHVMPSTLLDDLTLSILILLSLLLESLSLTLDLPLHLIASSDVLHLIHTLIIYLCFCEVFLNIVLVEQLGVLEFDVKVDASKGSVYLLAVALVIAWSGLFLFEVGHKFYY